MHGSDTLHSIVVLVAKGLRLITCSRQFEFLVPVQTWNQIAANKDEPSAKPSRRKTLGKEWHRQWRRLIERKFFISGHRVQPRNMLNVACRVASDSASMQRRVHRTFDLSLHGLLGFHSFGWLDSASYWEINESLISQYDALCSVCELQSCRVNPQSAGGFGTSTKVRHWKCKAQDVCFQDKSSLQWLIEALRVIVEIILRDVTLIFMILSMPAWRRNTFLYPW